MVGYSGNPQDTIIKGAKTRIFYVENPTTVIKDVTITGGDTGNAKVHGVGGYFHNGGYVYNCIVQANQSRAYGAYAAGIYMNSGYIGKTIFRNNNMPQTNSSGGCAIYALNTTIENCLIVGNTCKNANVPQIVNLKDSSKMINCTIASNKTANGTTPVVNVDSTSKIINTIIDQNTDTSLSLIPPSIAGTAENIINCATIEAIDGSVNSISLPNTARFADAANGDYHLSTFSPCLNTGLSLSNIATLCAFTPMNIDLDGENREKQNIDIGCYELQLADMVLSFNIESPQNGFAPYTVDFTTLLMGMSLEGTTFTWNFGDGFIETTSSTNISHTYTSYGVFTVHVKATDSNNTELNDSTGNNQIKVISEIMYVSQNSETPTFPYNTADNAASSIDEALNIAENGCTIIILDDIHVLPSTINLNKAVHIKGKTDNPADTIISPTKSINICKIENANAMISSLTMEKGKNYSSAAYDHNIYITSLGGTISNCVIRSMSVNGSYNGFNSVALENGLLTHSVITNCTVVKRTVVGNSAVIGILQNGRVENCLIAHNTRPVNTTNPGNNAGSAIYMSGGYAINNTIIHNQNSCNKLDSNAGYMIDDNTYVNAGAAVFVSDGVFANNVLADNTLTIYDPTTESTVDVKYPNVYATGNTFTISNCATDESTPISENSVVGTVDTFFINYNSANYRPAIFSPLINRGNSSYNQASLDLLGNTRIIDGFIDIGAFEAAASGTIIILK